MHQCSLPLPGGPSTRTRPATRTRLIGHAESAATVKEGAAAVDQFEADDITTDPTGHVTGKAEDRTDLSSGDYKIQSEKLSDLTVHVYANVAVATATNTMKGAYKGQDLSGDYRFTDTWVNRNGKWLVVASQYTKVLKAWPEK
jgi:ketosteroid isomerase-like protein